MVVDDHAIVEVESSFFVNNEGITPLNAELTSLVWGMIPFGIVIFFTFYKEESVHPKIVRGCIFFENVRDYSFPIVNISTITGLYFDYIIMERVVNNKCDCSRHSIPIYRFGEGRDFEKLVIEAGNVRCFYSQNAYKCTEKDYLQEAAARFLYFEKSPQTSIFTKRAEI